MKAKKKLAKRVRTKKKAPAVSPKDDPFQDPPSIDSRAVYALLAGAARSSLEKRGFVASNRGRTWTRRLDTKHVLVADFQCDKHGFQPYGGQFTLNLAVVAKKSGKSVLDGRYVDGLSEEDEVPFLATQNRVIAGIPKPGTDYPWDEVLGFSDGGQTARMFEPQASFEGDEWMRYYHPEDLSAWWTGFLEPRFDRLCAKFLRGSADPPEPIDSRVPSVEIPGVELREDGNYSVFTVPELHALRLVDALAKLAKRPQGELAVRSHAMDVLFDFDADRRTGTWECSPDSRPDDWWQHQDDRRGRLLLTWSLSRLACDELCRALAAPESAAGPVVLMELSRMKVRRVATAREAPRADQ